MYALAFSLLDVFIIYAELIHDRQDDLAIMGRYHLSNPWQNIRGGEREAELRDDHHSEKQPSKSVSTSF